MNTDKTEKGSLNENLFNENEFFDISLIRMKEILNSEISNREKFAQITTYTNTVRNYRDFQVMDVMNFKDLDLEPFLMKNVLPLK